MDRWRIHALEKLLKMELKESQRQAVLGELGHKYKVLLKGSWKRRRYFRWLYYRLRSIISLR